MRYRIRHQLSFVEPAVEHSHAQELQVINELISEHPEIADIVHQDLVLGLSDPDTGREGNMSAEQVIKALLIKQMNGFSYRGLEFHLRDSRTYRAFCGIGMYDETPSKSALQRDFNSISPETLEHINHILLGRANTEGVEKGRKIRIDCTVVESNIHKPTDSSLLSDSVRLLSRLTGRAKSNFNLDFHFVDHTKRAKKRAIRILNAKSKEHRRKPYRDLLWVTKRSVGYAKDAVIQLESLTEAGIIDAIDVHRGLRERIYLIEQVISQANRRVFEEERVLAADKVVSIFEPHTDIIVKGRRGTCYGHKITLAGGASGLVTDLVIESGNPADSTLAANMVARQREIYGRTPRQVVFDGGFASKANLSAIKGMGVKDAVFSKKRGLKIADMCD